MRRSLHLRLLTLSLAAAVLLVLAPGLQPVRAQSGTPSVDYPPSVLEQRREDLRQREQAETLRRKQRLTSRQRAYAQSGGQVPNQTADFISRRLPSGLRAARIAVNAAVASMIGLAAASAASSDASPFGELGVGSGGAGSASSGSSGSDSATTTTGTTATDITTVTSTTASTATSATATN